MSSTESVDVQEYDVFATEDGLTLGRGMSMNTETDVMTEGSTTPNTDAVTPRSGYNTRYVGFFLFFKFMKSSSGFPLVFHTKDI